MTSYVRSMTTIPEEDGVSEATEQGVCRKKSPFKEMCDTLQKMLDLSLLKDPAFCLYNVACFLCMSGFYVPYTYLPAYAITGGMSRTKAAYLLSIIGVFSTLARVITGWVSDRPWADCFMITNAALMVGGISTMLCPFCTTFTLRALYSVVYGMSTGRLIDSAVSLTQWT
ncbi:hypothetical protein NP493_474g02003 [Ridgeia piscesae]|uniref:Uncharacterized protein n=1 Tax=Ridgeia piscesae TaxID=27915 RepID=A0AAD9KZQ0_RIDPI|nr:hypothetical protein NP493_474g02003 [Ridgeia piscesae]